jgi:hypothetical protein
MDWWLVRKFKDYANLTSPFVCRLQHDGNAPHLHVVESYDPLTSPMLVMNIHHDEVTAVGPIYDDKP